MTEAMQEYSALEKAYEFFNERLFDGQLSNCLITLQRKSGARGYFSHNRFENRTIKGQAIDEIALNPATFGTRDDESILSTLVHEMVHKLQQQIGSPGRGRYHNKEWANMMEKVGLMPTSTGEKGGKKTGDKVTHLIVDGGRFQIACAELLATGLKLNWNSRENAGGKASSKKKDRIKFSCPGCDLNVWAKPSAGILCGECYEALDEIIVMEPA